MAGGLCSAGGRGDPFPHSAEGLVPFCGFYDPLVAGSLTVQEGVRLNKKLSMETSNSSCLGAACKGKSRNSSERAVEGVLEASCFLQGIAPQALNRRGSPDTGGITGIPVSAQAPCPVRAVDLGEREKQLPEDLYRHFSHCASASLQRQKVQIQDKKGLIMLPVPPVHSQLARCWEDCALLFIWLAGSLPQLPRSSLFPGVLSASCLQISTPTSCWHLFLLSKCYQTP